MAKRIRVYCKDADEAVFLMQLRKTRRYMKGDRRQFDLNGYLALHRNEQEPTRPVDRIVCKDGFSISVQASAFHYSEPRANSAPYYTEVECGFPSKPCPSMSKYRERLRPRQTHRDSVFGWVPVKVVERIITRHGQPS